MQKLATLTAAAALVLGFGAGQALAIDLFFVDDNRANPAVASPDCPASDGVAAALFFTTIQGAIAVAAADDIITVCPGKYSGTVIVGVADLELIGLKGTADNSCVKDNPTQPCVDAGGMDGKSAIRITASGVMVKGFRVFNRGTDPGDAGIHLEAGATGTVLRSNTAFENRHGIFILSNMNTLDSNHVKRNDQDGIHVQGDNNIFTDNKANRNGDDGFDILSSTGAASKNSTYSGNRTRRNGDCGFEDAGEGSDGVANYDTMGKDQDKAVKNGNKNGDNDIPGTTCSDDGDPEL